MASLSKREILRRKEDFNEIFRKGRWIGGKFIVIYYLCSEDRKIGFTVPKKVPNKVLKNRIKRKLRELYRTQKDLFPPKGHMILHGQLTVIDASYDDLLIDLKSVLMKLKKIVRNGNNNEKN
jgi:ribonuclease P protein component